MWIVRADISVVDNVGVAADFRVEGPDDIGWPELCNALDSSGIDTRRLAQPLSTLRDGAVLGPPTPTVGGGPVLQVVGGIDAARVHALRPGLNTVGRHSSCTFRLDDPEVSRTHLEVHVGARELTIRQCSVTGLTTVNGRALTGTRTLRPGDRIQVGSTMLSTAEPSRVSVPSTNVRITFPSPPATTGRAHFAVWGLLLPTVASLGTALVVGGRQFLLLAVIAAAAMIVSMVLGRRSAGGQRRAQRTYRAELAHAEATLGDAIDHEAMARRAEDPDPLQARRRGRPSTSGPVRVRLGLGSLLARLAVVTERNEVRHPDLHDVPVCLELGSDGLALTAPPVVARGQIRWILCQLAAAIEPAQLAIALDVDEDSERSWRWARWLPHLQNVRPSDDELAALQRWAGAGSGRLAVLVADTGWRARASAGVTVLHVGRPGISTAQPVDDTGVRQVLTRLGEPVGSPGTELEFAL